MYKGRLKLKIIACFGVCSKHVLYVFSEIGQPPKPPLRRAQTLQS